MVHRAFWFHILDKKIQRKGKYFASRALLDISKYRSVERQRADIQNKVGELEELNESLRNRDKMKDDAIAQYQINLWL